MPLTAKISLPADVALDVLFAVEDQRRNLRDRRIAHVADPSPHSPIAIEAIDRRVGRLNAAWTALNEAYENMS